MAIVLLHGWRNPAHERAVAAIARAIGFAQVTPSHEVGATIKLVPRGETAVADAYLSPPLRRYVAAVGAGLAGLCGTQCPNPGMRGEAGAEVSEATPTLLFMQSNGGLVAANRILRGATRSCRDRRAASSAWRRQAPRRGSTG